MSHRPAETYLYIAYVSQPWFVIPDVATAFPTSLYTLKMEARAA